MSEGQTVGQAVEQAQAAPKMISPDTFAQAHTRHQDYLKRIKQGDDELCAHYAMARRFGGGRTIPAD